MVLVCQDQLIWTVCREISEEEYQATTAVGAVLAILVLFGAWYMLR